MAGIVEIINIAIGTMKIDLQNGVVEAGAIGTVLPWPEVEKGCGRGCGNCSGEGRCNRPVREGDDGHKCGGNCGSCSGNCKEALGSL